MIGKDYSIYIHLPFCAHICGYCHFYVTANKEDSKAALLEALVKEWEQILPTLQGRTCVSIYFGGGTPALFGPERINLLLTLFARTATIAPDAEITLEVNPENASEALFLAYTKAGINRVSIGVQTFDDALLRLLTRHHGGQDAIAAVENAAKSGLKQISIDLMYDIPEQTRLAWQKTLSIACSLPITHLSLYNLTIEPRTAFDRKRDRLEKTRPLPYVSRGMYEEAIEKLQSHGWTHYEISAFGLKSNVSKHNLGYWTGRPFMGLGPSAYSYWEGKRFRNCADLKSYCLKVMQGESAIDFSEELSLEAAHSEHLILRLRTAVGVHIKDFQKHYGPFSVDTLSWFGRFEERGWLKEKEGHIILTREGQLFYDSIAVELV